MVSCLPTKIFAPSRSRLVSCSSGSGPKATTRVFEWKTFGLKIALAPVDNVDIYSLLGELVEHKQVEKFTVEGKEYGAVRNFCRFQKTQKNS